MCNRLITMVKSCCAVGCANRYSKGCGLKFYRFPTDPERRMKWVAAVDRKNWTPNEYSWLCSAHFIGGVKSNDPTCPDYVPSVFRHIGTPKKKRAQRSMLRYHARKATKKRRIEAQRRQEEERLSRVQNVDGQRVNSEVRALPAVSVMTDMSMNDISQLEDMSVGSISKLQEEVQRLREDNERLRKAIESERLTEEGFKSYSPQKIKYFTGLPSLAVFTALFNFIAPYVGDSASTQTTLPLFQQFVMVLMKLRLNLGDQYLAYQFGVHNSTISRYFKKWVNVMYMRLKPLIKWPGRGELLKTMPVLFRKSFRTCVIIDCFEIFIERPTSLKPRAQTWSNYKQHNTVKFLIGVAPQGVISFISKGWGGRVSDVHLTENCGLLENMLPGDLILADRGFTIQESAGMYCAQVKLPPFTKGKRQLSQLEVDTSRQLSSVRIHVERVIGVLRQKYSFLEGTLPINMLMANDNGYSMIDKIVTVCCALCNCCESVVPFD